MLNLIFLASLVTKSTSTNDIDQFLVPITRVDVGHSKSNTTLLKRIKALLKNMV